MSKHDLPFTGTLLNAAGSLGFYPDPRGPVDLALLGGFFTNPVSRGRRTPARGPRLLGFPGGNLIHTGLPNPGLSAILRLYAARWARSSLSIVVHLLAEELSGLAGMVQRLEEVEGVMGIEVGLRPDIDADAAHQITLAALGELCVIVRLPLERAVELAPVVIEAGADAVSLAAPRGALPGPEGEVATGRLYGPAVFPQALAVALAVAQLEVPVIGGGGVYKQEDVEAMLAAGAMAVQVDTVLWRGGIE